MASCIVGSHTTSFTHQRVLSMDLMLLSANSTHPQMSLWKGKPSALTVGSAIMFWQYWITPTTTITFRLLGSEALEKLGVSKK